MPKPKDEKVAVRRAMTPVSTPRDTGPSSDQQLRDLRHVKHCGLTRSITPRILRC